MKVIEKGRKQSGWSKQYRCTGAGNSGGGCGALLLVSETDVYVTTSHSYGDNFPDNYDTFKCPDCGVETDIKNMPTNITRGGSNPRNKSNVSYK